MVLAGCLSIPRYLLYRAEFSRYVFSSMIMWNKFLSLPIMDSLGYPFNGGRYCKRQSTCNLSFTPDTIDMDSLQIAIWVLLAIFLLGTAFPVITMDCGPTSTWPLKLTDMLLQKAISLVKMPFTLSTQSISNKSLQASQAILLALSPNKAILTLLITPTMDSTLGSTPLLFQGGCIKAIHRLMRYISLSLSFSLSFFFFLSFSFSFICILFAVFFDKIFMNLI